MALTVSYVPRSLDSGIPVNVHITSPIWFGVALTGCALEMQCGGSRTPTASVTSERTPDRTS